VFGEQFGPGRSSRALAIVHIAIFDAVNAVVGGYQSYTRLRAASEDASVEAAIALAAHDTLTAALSFAEGSSRRRARRRPQHPPRRARQSQRASGSGVRPAAAILARPRADDGAQHP